MEITEKQLMEFQNDTDVFRPGLLQDFITFIDFIYEKGISIYHAYDCIGQMRINQVRQVEEFAKKRKTITLKPCPKCGNNMKVIPVNDSPRFMVGGDYLSMAYCLDDKGCGHEEYSKVDIREAIKKINHPNRK